MPASSSFIKGLASSLAAPVFVIAIALRSAASANSPISLCLLAQPIALSCAVAFFAIAAYVSLAEHPARMLLADDSAALTQWQPSYKRAAAIQAPLAAFAAIMGAMCWRQSAAAEEGAAADPLWLLGACAAAFNLPFTVFVILPTNRILLSAKKGSSETRRLLVRWGHLHDLRTVAGGVASACFLVAVAKSSGSSTSLSSWGPVASLRQLLRLSKSDYGV